MLSNTAKRRRNVAKIRLTLIAVVVMQFPNLIYIVTSQVSSWFKEDAFTKNLQLLDFSNLTLVDLAARKAMHRLHDDLDDDNDGNVSLSEGADFIDREDIDGASGNLNLPGFATDKDGRITETEFWDSWTNSTVHNWTVSEMVEWLTFEVDLPQYAKKFKHYQICGAAMPIIAGNSSFVLSLVDGIKEHRLKLWLKAMEVVLCGYTKSKSHFLKDVLLLISVGLACGGIAYAFYVHHSAAKAVAVMQEKLNNLQNEMKRLEDEDQWIKDSSTSDDCADDKLLRDDSSLSFVSSSNLQSRLDQVMDELTDTRMLLERAEERLNDQRWRPSSRLLACLKATHRVELKLHESKRHEAHKKVEFAKSQFVKMRKKSYVQLLHSRQVDSFDVEIQVAKDFLREVQRDAHEYKSRWREIENICDCSFLSKSYRVATVKTHNHSSVSSFSRKVSIDETSEFMMSMDGDNSGLSMKDFPYQGDFSSVKDYHSEKFHATPSRDHRHSEPISNSAHLSVPESCLNSHSTIPEDDSPAKNRMSSRKTPSPKGSRKQFFLRKSKSEKTKSGEQLTSDINDNSFASSRGMTKSTFSLPNLTSGDSKEVLGDGCDQQSYCSLDNRNGKVARKRVNLFKKNK